MSLLATKVETSYPANMLQLGLGHRLRFTSTEIDGVDYVVGAIHEHPRQRPPDHGPNPDWHAPDFGCASAIWFDVPEARQFDTSPDAPRPRWHIVSFSPLTLTPSLWCRTCGAHGFVVNNAWVPA